MRYLRERTSDEPGLEGYLVAAVIFLGTSLFFTWQLLNAWYVLGRGLIQVVVAGEQEIVLPQTGTYTIFYEHDSFVGDVVYHTGRFNGLQMVLTSLETESQYPAMPWPSPAAWQGIAATEVITVEKDDGRRDRYIGVADSNLKYTTDEGRRKGIGVADVAIGRPGAYRVETWYASGIEGPEIVLALGYASVSDFDAISNRLMIAMSASGAVAGAIIIYTWYARGRRFTDQILLWLLGVAGSAVLYALMFIASGGFEAFQQWEQTITGRGPTPAPIEQLLAEPPPGPESDAEGSQSCATEPAADGDTAGVPC
jgi:hypothetical protein